jgi:asparagine N-glycosylation enzyme membrane subunit Stt3
MKKFFYYYLPIVIYYAVFLFVLLSLFLIKPTPETANVIIKYEPNFVSFIARIILLPLLGISYCKFFFHDLLSKFNKSLLKNIIDDKEILEIEEERMQKILNLITVSLLLMLSMIGIFLC